MAKVKRKHRLNDGTLLPPGLLVGGVIYPIESVKADKLEGLAAKTYHGTPRIEINRDLGGGIVRQTLLHEVLHTLTAQYIPWLSNRGSFPMRLPKDREELEECIVLAFEAPLYQVMRQNPELVLWLMEGLFYDRSEGDHESGDPEGTDDLAHHAGYL